MRALGFAALTAAAGLALAAGGALLVKRMDRRPGEGTVFVRIYSPRVLLTMVGWLLTALGLILVFLFAPMVYIGAR